MVSIENLIKENVKLFSPPAIAVRILDAVKKEEGSFRELSGIIEADPALSARVLKIANSSFYALPYKVDSIDKALQIVGIETLKNTALSFVITGKMKGHEEGSFDFDFFWKRSITAAVGADLIASLINRKTDETFVTALLQDIGIVIMYFGRSNEYLRVLDEKKSSGRPIEIVEKEIFGFDHQELGSEALKEWGLSENIYMPIRYHHFDGAAPEDFSVQADILLLSDWVSSVYHGSKSTEKLRSIREILGRKYGKSSDEVDALVDSAAEGTIEILSSFEIDPGEMKPFSQIMQEANEELSRMNLSYEQLVVELKQAKETAEKLANELKDANDKLREMAFRDGLTNLYNRRYFQELMELELDRSNRYKRQFSFIMFDIDHFKKVNDTFGHSAGDAVIREIASLANRMTRDTDMVARYGGEEFAVILPETDMRGALVLAERLRIAIEKLEVPWDGSALRATVSLGVTTCTPESGINDTAIIIDAADKALYNSKAAGRNKVGFVGLSGS
ncbi:MAG: diguanylate cyclase [Deltaproteobacteria bacterium]|nr:diguanylate cyclase [Deltaproteobacteria bacterium]